MKTNKIKYLILPTIIIYAALKYINTDFSNKNNFRTDTIGGIIPETELQDIDSDNVVTTSDFEGNKSILVFHASWCSSCIKNYQFLENISQKNPSTPIYGIVLNDKKENIKRLHENYKNPFTQDFIPLNDQIFTELNIVAIPQLMILNEENKIVFHYMGKLNNEVINKHIIPIITK